MNNNVNNNDIIFKQQPKDILLVPRREVSLKFYQEHPTPFFIDKRKKTCSKGLNTPSRETATGLSSGIRSVIVLDEQEGYIKLKGVKPSTTRKEEKYGGGVNSLLNCELDLLSKVDPKISYIGMKPYVAFVLGVEFSNGHLQKTDMELSDSTKTVYLESLQKNRYYKKKTSCKKTINSLFTIQIPSFKIKGDTRLDEIIYALTLEKYDSKKTREISNLMTRLCENAATTHCKLFLSGLIFDKYASENTDIHIGNVVLYEEKGEIKDTIVDITSFDKSRSKQLLKNLSMTKDVFKSFSWDFEDACMCSIPYMKYSNFDDRQRKLCAEAFYNGYKKFLKKAAGKSIDKEHLVETLDSIKTHKITKEELDHYIADKVIYQ